MAVVNGNIVAGHLVKRCCERHLFDLERSKEPNEDIYFDEAAADRVFSFFAKLKQSKGKWRGKPLRLLTWQKFVIGCLFGWKLKSTGLRRFRTAYEEVARKNGKTTKLAGVGLYGLVGDMEGGPEVYCAATKRDQAKILFSEARRMVRQSPPLRRRIKNGAKELFCSGNDGTMVPLSADANTMDGLNPSMNLVDELHAHKTREVWDVLDTAVGSREQPLQFGITTAGFSAQTENVCWEQRQYSVDVLEGFDKPDGVKDDGWFAYIACIDEGDDWRDPDVWVKANPSLGETVNRDELAQKCEQAKVVRSRQNAFKRLRLNIWTDQDEIWIDLAKWDQCGAPFDRDMLLGRECYGGLDVSSKLDLSAFVLVFPPIEGDPRWYVRSWAFLPEERVAVRAQRDNDIEKKIREWEADGDLILTPGDVIDQDLIHEKVCDCAEDYDIVEIGFDPWNATALATKLTSDGFEMVEIRQGIRTYAEPSKEFEALYYSGRLAHGGSKLMRWNAEHVAIRYDENENFMPAKKKSKDRIDLICGAIMGLSRAIAPDDEDGKVKLSSVIDVSA